MRKRNNNQKRVIIIASVILVLIAAVCLTVLLAGSKYADKMTTAEATKFVNNELRSLPDYRTNKDTEFVNEYLASVSSVTVQSMAYGENRDIKLSCRYETVDAYAVYLAHKQELFRIIVNNSTQSESAITIMKRIKEPLLAYMKAEAQPVSGEITLYLYKTEDGLRLHLSDETVNTCLAGMADISRDIAGTMTVGEGEGAVSIERFLNYRNGFSMNFGFRNYDSTIPNTSNIIERTWDGFCDDFYNNFVKNARWHYLRDGLLTTLKITGCAALIGIVIGFIVAIIRCTYLKTKKLRLANLICRLYLTVVRGTPLMIQLLVVYFVILLPIGIPKFTSAVICFGFNSGAYVAEIVRGGIMSVDVGQTEAGRSLGFNYIQTMTFIIIPQAFKAVLPSLANEFITLLKESSVAFYIGVADLTQAGLVIRAVTFSDFLPLVAVAVIYLVVVVFLSYLVSILERRLRKSER